MTAQGALRMAEAAGVTVGLRGDKLTLHASTKPPPAVLDALLLRDLRRLLAMSRE